MRLQRPTTASLVTPMRQFTPQIKPYVTYMTSSEDSYKWSKGASDSDETRFGIEAEIWF